MISIRRRLLLWLFAGLTLSTAVAAVAVYLRARVEAQDLFDYQLQLMAAAFPRQGFGIAAAPPSEAADEDNVVVVQIWDASGAQLYLSRPGAAAPENTDLGFSTVASPGGSWRVYSAVVGDNVVQVSQPTRARDELAASLALRTMLPLLVLVPVLMMLSWVTVGRGLKPLNEVTSAVGRRSADDLEPLPDRSLPREVMPLVAALNRLLARLDQALSLQRSFIADAAHELRTPLTAVRLQTQIAERASSDAERTAAFAQLKSGTERAARLVEQLLALARTEPEATERALMAVSLGDVARQVVAAQAAIAEAKRVELGLSSDAAVNVQGDSEALRVMLGNLVDNAVRYTPSGGTVDVTVSRDGSHACVAITDTGPGIPPSARERVFDRFYRHQSGDAQGSGLGLAIVRRIAQRHGATIELADGPGGAGLKVVVRFAAG